MKPSKPWPVIAAGIALLAAGLYIWKADLHSQIPGGHDTVNAIGLSGIALLILGGLTAWLK